MYAKPKPGHNHKLVREVALPQARAGHRLQEIKEDNSMQRILVTIVTWVFLAMSAQAQSVERLDELVDALGLPEMLEIIRQEGVEYGEELGRDMLAEKAGSQWQERVADIYDLERNQTFVLSEFGKGINPGAVDEILAFFQSPVGVEIIALEVAARHALLDDDLSDANDVHVAELRDQKAPRIEQLAEFIRVNDLLEINVTSSLNSSFAFFTGLVDGGAYDQPLSEDKILQEVWSQEASIRAETETWLYGFLSMAYSPLTDAEMQAYIDFSETEAGKNLNIALFDAFNLMFDRISYALGAAAAESMKSEAL